MSFNIPRTQQKRLIIVGGGLGGLELANKLKKSSYQIVLIDKNNYHQFLPLIYQVASAGIEPSSIIFPFRKLFQNRKNFYFRLAEVRSIFPEKKIIQTSIGKIEYDYIVFAAGTTSNFFGNKHIQDVAIPMKNVTESMGLRNALLANFERAITCVDKNEKRELLNVVIVGGGATGVEIAGALSEMKKFVIKKDYPEMESDDLNIYLIEASDRLLAGMSQEASDGALGFLTKMGVKVQLNQKVVGYENNVVLLESGNNLPSRSFIWVSGVTAVAIGNMNPDHLGRGARIKVDQYNKVTGLDNVFAIGDQCIQTSDAEYPQGHPQLAQVAIQQARNLAKNLNRIDAGKAPLPFMYKNLGSMATIGRHKAVADFKKVKIKGWFAWIIWLVIHLRSILGVRNKIVVLLNWIWNYITYDQSLRLIMYSNKVKEIKNREAKEAVTHWGEDLNEKAE